VIWNDSSIGDPGYDTMARRAELVALNVEDFSFMEDGSGRAMIRRSKTDQAGEGSKAYLSPDTVGYLKTWLRSSKEVSGHSIRVEATQDMLALNIDLVSVMQAGRWKTTAMPMRYGEDIRAGLGGMARTAKAQGRVK